MRKIWTNAAKRILSAFLCAAMVFSLIPQLAWAAASNMSVLSEGIAGSDLSTGSGKDVTAQNQIYFTPETDGYLTHHGRYLIMNAKTGYIMSYDAISSTGYVNIAKSLSLDADGGSENTYYMSGNNVILDHSDRDNTMWVLRFYNNLYSGLSNGSAYQWVNTSTPKTIYGGKPYQGIDLQKGRYGPDDAGTSGIARHGYYWHTPHVTVANKQNMSNSVSADVDNQLHFTHLCFRSDTTPFKNEIGNSEMTKSAQRPNYQIEALMTTDSQGNLVVESYLIYYVENATDGSRDYRFVYCDEYGNWGVRRYMDNPVSGAYPWSKVQSWVEGNELDMLKHKLYEYKESSESKSVNYSGYSKFYAVAGMDKADVVDAIHENLTVYDTDHQNQIIPCSGANGTAKVGYYWLDTSNLKMNTTGTYTVDIMYQYNTTSGVGSTKIGTVTVEIGALSETSVTGTGIISLNSRFNNIVYSATASGDSYVLATDENGKYSPLTVTLPGGAKAPVTVAMLYKQDEQGNLTRFDTSVSQIHHGVTLKYAGQVITDDLTIVVSNGTIASHMPDYPEEGSVRVNKDGITTQAEFAQNGVANIQLSATGKPITTGLDVVIMLDLSSSMRYGVDTNTSQCDPYYNKGNSLNVNGDKYWTFNKWQKTRMYAMEESLKQMVKSLQGTNADVRIAMADFGDIDHYEFVDSRMWDGTDYSTNRVYLVLY